MREWAIMYTVAHLFYWTKALVCGVFKLGYVFKTNFLMI